MHEPDGSPVVSQQDCLCASAKLESRAAPNHHRTPGDVIPNGFADIGVVEGGDDGEDEDEDVAAEETVELQMGSKMAMLSKRSNGSASTRKRGTPRKEGSKSTMRGGASPATAPKSDPLQA